MGSSVPPRYYSKTHRIVLGGIENASRPILEALVDANYASCLDTRRCLSGYITFSRRSPIS